MVRRTSQAGFTLIEVLLVLVIILMLASAVVVFVMPEREGAQRNATRVQLDGIVQALERFALGVGQYPTEEMGGLQALVERPEFENERLADRWNGPYVRRGTDFVDVWGFDLIYERQDADAAAEGNGPGYLLFSVGPDGQRDTDDDIYPTGMEPDDGQ